MHSRTRALVFGAPLSALISASILAFGASPAQAQTIEKTGPIASHDDGDGSPDFRELLHVDLGPLTLQPVVLIQAQAIPYVGKDSFLQSGDPAERGGFRMRRARFGLEGKLYDRVPFRITAEFDSDEKGTAHLHDAWFGYDKWKSIQLFAGARDLPFSRSAMIESGGGAMIERPLAVRAMAPFHQLGMSVEGHLWKGALNYALGVYNGLERSDRFYEGYGENAALLGNRFDGLTYAARLDSEPLGSLGNTIEDLRKGPFRVGMGASFFFSNGGTRNLVGAGGDVLLHSHGFHLLGEFISNHASPHDIPTQPTAQISTVQSLAMIGELGYMIVKNRFGVNARFEWIDPNTSVKDEADSWLASGGLGYHVLHDFLKANLDFTHRQEIHGNSLKNDSLVFQLQLNL
ncbi:MAG: porin [Byssovorax sp.]